MAKSNLSRWINLITQCSRQGQHSHALRLFTQMRSLLSGPHPHPFVVPSVLRACAHLSDLRAGELIHALTISHPLLNADAFVSSALVDMYSKCGLICSARQVFDEATHRDLVVWNSIVSAYAHRGLPECAMALSVKMQGFGLKADLVTWNAVISGFARIGNHQMAMVLFRFMQVQGFRPDVITWTSLVSGFVLNFQYGNAREVFREMVVGAGVVPSSATISTLLPAFANVADARHGREVHGYAVVLGVEEDLTVGSALVDMYSKCGLVFEAKKIFDMMRERSTVTWNAMIFGLAYSGYCRRAVGLFDQMLSNGTKPDHLTFTAFLTACSYGGMVELGKGLFRAMQQEYGIGPRLEHYACMVDLLGRAGKLVEAYDFIKEMPVEPDYYVWGALLGACRRHRNVELAKIATSHLLKLEPESAASCLLFSNVLVDAGRDRDALEIKKLIKKRRLEKLSGSSWVQTA